MIGLFCCILPSPLHTDMQAIFLLLLLAGASKGLDFICDATQEAACYGALRRPVYLLLTRRTSVHELQLYSGSKTVFAFRRSRTVFRNKFNTTSYLQRWQFVPDNWTLIINPAERRDSETYRVEIYGSTGRIVGTHTVQLIIETPVSEVNLSVSCSANGKRRARCSSNGDSPQYSWSLDGRRLSEADADLGPDNQTLLLNVTGELTCSVRNHVSSANTSAQLVCSVSATTAYSPVFISVWLAEFIILTSLLVGEHCLHKRNKRLHTPGEHEDQELELTLTSKSHRRRRTIEEAQTQ